VLSLFQADVYVGHVPRSNLVSEEDKVAEVAFKTYVDGNGTVAASDLVKVAYDLGCFGQVNQPCNPNSPTVATTAIPPTFFNACQ
jgi:hypothetical protein